MERIEVENIGKVTLKWGLRYKTVKLKISAKEGIVLTFPHEFDKSKAMQLLYNNIAWVKKNAQKAKQEFKQYIFTEYEIIHSKYRKIKIKRHISKNIKLHADNTSAIIYIPEQTNLHTIQSQESIRKMYEVILKNEAEHYIMPRAISTAQKHKIQYNSFSIRPSRTRWGSCSSINKITFSSYLVLLPEHLIEYVIYHELAHVQEKHHQKSFWTHLQKLLPNAIQLDEEMRNYRTLYLNKINMD